MRPFFVILCLLVFTRLYAQDESLFDWDIDSIFDEPLEESEFDDTKSETTAADIIKQQSFNFSASYSFTTGIMPGWSAPPWGSDGSKQVRSLFLDRAILMTTSISMDAQISRNFRVYSSFGFQIPAFGFGLGNFFFDYNLNDVVFFRGGKFSQSWGISPNYNFTDLLARVSPAHNAGESFIFKADIPSGVGGFQFLVMTRENLMAGGMLLGKEDFGYGAKYNLAFSGADIDMGLFYQDGMALRSFLSVKTTIRKTDVYSEGLIAIDINDPSNSSGAVSLGFGKDFLEGKLSVNSELFYNGEKGAFWYRPETNMREAGSVPFIEGLNIALNLQYKFGVWGDPRVYTQIRYALLENSAQFIPGFVIYPLPHISVSFAMPMALGDRYGYYSRNTPTVNTLGQPIPFRMIFLVSLSGGINFGISR